MRKIFAILTVLLIASCTQTHDEVVAIERQRNHLPEPTRTEITEPDDDLMVLGEQQANPYTVSIMQQARIQALEKHPDISIPEITPSHYYIRFAPRNEDELYALLQDTTINFFDFPLDREVISGTYYHDPAIADSLPTYQYASIPKQKWLTMALNVDAPFTILEQLFIPEEVENFFDNNIGGGDWGDVGDGNIRPIDPIGPWIPAPDDPIGPLNGTNSTSSNITNDDILGMLINNAMVIAGLETEEEQQTAQQMGANSAWFPSGRITAYDDIVGAQIPLEGVRVQLRTWRSCKSAVTDANGNFYFEDSFTRKVGYSIKWNNPKWKIVNGIGAQTYYNGSKTKGSWIVSIGINSPKHLARATVHRALYRIYYKDLGGLSRPSYPNVRVSYRHTNNDGVYGAFLPNNGKPKVRLWGKDPNSNVRVPSLIFSALCHELGGHGVHYQNSSSYSSLQLKYVEAWAVFAQFYLTFLEYEELNVLSRLNVYSASNKNIDDDIQYNFQYWHEHLSPTHERYHYPPLFVDIYDNYNQREESSDPFGIYFPNDNVMYANASGLESIVFSSQSFEQVKAALSTLYNLNNVYCNFDESSLNELFRCYDYE